MRRVRALAAWKPYLCLPERERRARTARPRAIHIYEQRGETQMCTPLLSRHRSCRVMSDMTRSAPPLIQRADAMFRPRPIGTTVIVCLKLGFPVACLAIRGSDTAAGLTAGLSARTGRRHRAARSLRCARPSDLHPDGRIAGFLARMRAYPAGWLRRETTAGVCHSARPEASCSGQRPARPEPASAVSAVQPPAGARHDGNPMTADHHVICI
jgi:hypothetical protein